MIHVLFLWFLVSGTPVVTTISLQHTLKVDYQPLSYPANTNVDNYIITPGDIRDNPFIGNGRPPRPPPDGRRPPPNGRRPPPPPPDGRPPPEYAPQYGNEQYGFNSDSYEGGSNVNSKPQESKDPSTVYNGNPFFSSSTSKPLANFPGGETIPARESVIQDNRNTVSKNIRSGIPYQAICGRPVATNSLVFHGQAVPIGAYPWLAALFRVKATGLNYMCSASLISDKHVVTAAHCVKQENKKLRPDDLLIILGKLNIQKWSQGDGEKMLDPESIHIHPDYQALSSDADIAVIILKESLEFTKLIRPICLWGMESSDLQNVVGKEGTVVGWGKDENGDLITAEPKQIALPIVSQETCLRSSYTFADITSNRTFCAGYRDGTGPCNGDSGSGFILKRGDRWMLRGIVSMSISDTQKFTCDLKNYVVFTDASKFLPWLMSFLT